MLATALWRATIPRIRAACSSGGGPEPRACTTRRSPDPGTPRRQRLDRAIAVFVLVVETLVCLTLWGPQPVAWLWVGSQVDYHSGSVTLGIAVAFAGMIASLMLTLVLAVRLDAIWKVVRRAGGIDQREGALRASSRSRRSSPRSRSASGS